MSPRFTQYSAAPSKLGKTIDQCWLLASSLKSQIAELDPLTPLVPDPTGSYTVSSITVDRFGRVTAASSGSAVTAHGSLSGLQGGQTSQYYHLTEAEYTTLQAGTWTHNSMTGMDGGTGAGTFAQYYHLTADQHTSLTAFGDESAYALLAGRAASQTLKGSTAVDGYLKLVSTAGVGTTDYISLCVGSNGGTEALRVIHDGKVGIGTAAPGELLEVMKDGAGANVLMHSNTSAWVRWSTDSGSAIPSTTAHSTGAKLILYDTAGGGYTDCAIGIQGGPDMWFSIPGATNAYKFHWYGGTSELVTVQGDGYVGIGIAAPLQRLSVQQSGTPTADTSILSLTNSGNAASMTNTRTSILFNQWYYDAVTPAVADAASITVGTEGNWTSTAGTQDAYMAFGVAVDGTVTEVGRFTSAGVFSVPAAAASFVGISTPGRIQSGSDGGGDGGIWLRGADYSMLMGAKSTTEMGFYINYGWPFVVDVTGLTTINPGTTPSTALRLDIAALTAEATRDSHAIQWTGRSSTVVGTFGANYTIDWQQYVDVTSTAGASAMTWQSRIDAADYATRMTLDSTGLLTLNPGTTPATALWLDIAGPETSDSIDSHDIMWTARHLDGAIPHRTDWRIYVDAYGNDGDSCLRIQQRLDLGSWTTYLNMATDGTVGDFGMAHVNTTGKQGGTTNEYYHLTAAEYGSAGGTSTWARVGLTFSSGDTLILGKNATVPGGDGSHVTIRPGAGLLLTGDPETPDGDGGNLYLRGGIKGSGGTGADGVDGSVNIGDASTSAVNICESSIKLGFFGTTAIVRNATPFTLNSGSGSYDLPASPTAQQVGDCLRQLLTYLGDAAGNGLVNITA